MNFCPRAFNSDMTDPGNLAYCREIQRKNGESCKRKRCGFYAGGGGGAVVEEREPKSKRSSQGGLF